MRHQCLLVACLIGSVLASPVPSRAPPFIGVVVPSDLPAIPTYGMGDSIERPAPSPLSPVDPSTTTSPIPSTTFATSTSTAASTDIAMKPGSRYQGYGNVALSSSASTALAGMGEAVSRPRPANKSKTISKRNEDDIEVVVEWVEYENGVVECTDPSTPDPINRNDMKRTLEK